MDRKKAFKTHYPNAVNVEWEKENKGFEAEFSDGDKKREVLFDNERNILKEELDEAVDGDKEQNESEEVDGDDDGEEK